MKRKVIMRLFTKAWHKHYNSIQIKYHKIRLERPNQLCQVISAINTELINSFNNIIKENKSTLLILTIQT